MFYLSLNIMKISVHADRTMKIVGIRAEDIHKWIDGLFDRENFELFLKYDEDKSYNPYDHRKFRHCIEALDDAYEEFKEKYSREQIKNVFECHIKDDYNGYLPTREDFENGTFTEKYHENDEKIESEKILSKKELTEYFNGKAYSQKNQFASSFSKGFILRIIVPIIIAIIIFMTSVFILVIPVFRNNMIENKKEMIKELTATSISLIEHYIKLEKKGNLTKTNAQKLAADHIQEIRYGSNNKDYFWITDMSPNMIMHPYRTDLIGRDLSNYKDSKTKNGKKLFVEFVKLVKENGSGYLEYFWQWQDDASLHIPKLSYVKGIPQWNWIIGTGIYINDIDEELFRLRKNLFIILAFFSIILIIILLNVIFQSHKIEKDRLKAETGLREAKDRYRALVEASNEGQILEIDGFIVYSNFTLQRMLGFSDKELVEKKTWELFKLEKTLNSNPIAILRSTQNGTLQSKPFEAQLSTKTGEIIDVIITVSRIFFSSKNGHIISFRPIVHKPSGLINYKIFSYDYSGVPLDILTEIKKSKNVGHIIHSLNRLPNLIREIANYGVKPDILRGMIGKMYDAAIKKFILLSIDTIGKPPVSFAFLSLGSNARHEMTMFSDQDNALIFDDVDNSKIEKIKRYFLSLANGVCAKLDKAGYRFCPGGIMAMNPQYCLSISEWKNLFSEWILDTSTESILKVNIFLDIFSPYGDKKLVKELQSHIMSLVDQNPLFFIHFAQNCLNYKAPLNLLGNIKTETKDGIKSINIKESLKPIEIIVRIYALKNKITKPGTISRLKKLIEIESKNNSSFKEMLFAFDYLWQLRFSNQIFSHAELKSVNDELDLNTINDIETLNLKNILSKISEFQTKLSYDFLGG